MVKHTSINNESIIALSNNFQVRNVVSLTTNMKKLTIFCVYMINFAMSFRILKIEQILNDFLLFTFYQK